MRKPTISIANEEEGIRLSDYEKEKAEVILKQLEGMSITSAKALLKKCSKALMMSKVQEVHMKRFHSPGGSLSKNDINAE